MDPWSIIYHERGKSNILYCAPFACNMPPTNFFSYEKTKLNTTITNIRVDNGGEFFSMRDFFPQ